MYHYVQRRLYTRQRDNTHEYKNASNAKIGLETRPIILLGQLILSFFWYKLHAHTVTITQITHLGNTDNYVYCQ